MQIGFLSALGLLFIGLKLGGVINWSWAWVLLPLWGPVAFAAALALGVGIGYVSFKAIEIKFKEK